MKLWVMALIKGIKIRKKIKNLYFSKKVKFRSPKAPNLPYTKTFSADSKNVNKFRFKFY